MNTRKMFALFLCIVFLLCLSACTGAVAKRNLKIGFIATYGENDERTQAHLDGLSKAMEQAGIEKKQFVFISDAVPETAFDSVQSLVNDGCKLIFSGSRDLEDVMVQSATENNDVDFCVFGGVQSTNGLSNYHTYSFHEFETRYLLGVLAGEKLNDLISNGEINPKEALLGYIASERDAENISAYTAFLLGARSVCETSRMYVQYTYAEENDEANRSAALALLSFGCRLIAQQDVSTEDVAAVCEENNAYYLGYMKDENDAAPYFFLGTANIDYETCYAYAIQCALDGSLPTEWSKGYQALDSFVSSINDQAFTSEEKSKKAEETISAVVSELLDETRHVFDTQTWTVKKKAITSTADMDENFDVEYINEEGYFMENELGSNPKFEFHIDGIKELNPNEITIESTEGNES